MTAESPNHTRGQYDAWRGINMLMLKHSRLILLCLLLACSQQVRSEDFAQNYKKIWQLKRLLFPSSLQLKMEQHQKIFTYVGLTDREVDQAMSENFDRIESFMIANVIVTDENGDPKRDPETGEVITEEDGC